MTAVAMCAALAWVMITLHVEKYGGSVLKRMAGFWFNAIVVQIALWTGEHLSK